MPVRGAVGTSSRLAARADNLIGEIGRHGHVGVEQQHHATAQDAPALVDGAGETASGGPQRRSDTAWPAPRRPPIDDGGEWFPQTTTSTILVGRVVMAQLAHQAAWARRLALMTIRSTKMVVSQGRGGTMARCGIRLWRSVFVWRAMSRAFRVASRSLGADLVWVDDVV